MLRLDLVICNIWTKDKFKNLWNKAGSITKHKHWEVELYRYYPEFLGIRLDTCWRGGDHAGFSVELILLGYTFRAKIYDSRHWNYFTNSWEIYTGEYE